MNGRQGEKLGWTLGWLGSFLWVVILAALFLFQGKVLAGATGLALAGAAGWAVARCAPWQRPTTPYWQLMLAPYACLFLSIPWAIQAFGGLADSGLSWWNLGLLLPVLSPLFVLGRRRWTDGEARQD